MQPQTSYTVDRDDPDPVPAKPGRRKSNLTKEKERLARRNASRESGQFRRAACDLAQSYGQKAQDSRPPADRTGSTIAQLRRGVVFAESLPRTLMSSSPPSRLSSTLEVSRSPKAYPDSYQQVAPLTVELHPRGVVLPPSRLSSTLETRTLPNAPPSSVQDLPRRSEHDLDSARAAGPATSPPSWGPGVKGASRGRSTLSSGAELRRKAWRSLPSRLSSTLEVSRSPKAYPDSYQQVAPLTVELHPRGVALFECLPTPDSYQELSSAERRGARSSLTQVAPLTVELHPRGVALFERLPTPDSYQELSSAERRGARSSLTVELHPQGVALAESLPMPVERHLELSRSPNAYLRLTLIRS
ncbi:hypothetical protein GGX14DRAFT_653470 [Mycena pura]|uniref:Uncharacterized protein n=1 Tax=Mycena pura TaxID=153505 RepID=A0AAD6V5S9_9AGAR|nr:hypothetical protein GGX14DRAFT_653470 [Mycena pura]